MGEFSLTQVHLSMSLEWGQERGPRQAWQGHGPLGGDGGRRGLDLGTPASLPLVWAKLC